MMIAPRRLPFARLAAATAALLLIAPALGPTPLVAGDTGGKEWPMWGGTPDRNMVSSIKGLPTEWDVKTKKNVKWVATLGSQTYGNTIVAGGAVPNGFWARLGRWDDGK